MKRGLGVSTDFPSHLSRLWPLIIGGCLITDAANGARRACWRCMGVFFR